VQKLQTYCSEELGGFYLDVLKDRLYITGKTSLARRSAQTALYHIRDLVLKLMAPVLSFTAEEAWRIVHPEDPTILVRRWEDAFPKVPNAPRLLEKWQRLLAVRALVLKELENLRVGGGIGSSLQAEVTLTLAADDYALFETLGDDLRFVLITSAARIVKGKELRIEVTPSTGVKCERCWHWRHDVGRDVAHPTLCGRCVDNLFGEGEARRHA
jgi:isoleucyl-tRNA synthetase